MNRVPWASLADVIESAEYVPMRIDPVRRLVQFARIGREGLRRSAFVAAGVDASGHWACANVDDVLLYSECAKANERPLHFIFITAFCCSTLLARFLDNCPRCVVLREPSILGELAIIKIKSLRCGPARVAWSETEWLGWVRLAMSLLARGAESERAIVVKLADPCNAMMDALVEGAGDGKPLLLYTGLRTFIVSVLKSESRREWMRERVKLWRCLARATDPLAGIRPVDMDDALGAAYLWLTTARLWTRARARWPTRKFQIMDGGLVADDPASALAMVNDCFQLALDCEDVKAATERGGVRERHSKSSGAYSAHQRGADERRWEATYGSAAERAISAWSRVAPEIERLDSWLQ